MSSNDFKKEFKSVKIFRDIIERNNFIVELYNKNIKYAYTDNDSEGDYHVYFN